MPPSPPGSVALNSNVIVNLKYIIQTDWDSLEGFIYKFSLPYHTTRNIFYTNQPAPPPLLRFFCDLNILTLEFDHYLIPSRELIRCAVLRLLKTHGDLKKWLTHHKIPRRDWLLFANHYTPNDYIISCLKMEGFYIDNDTDTLVTPLPSKKTKLKKGSGRNSTKMSPDERELRDKIINKWGSLECYIREKNLRYASFRNAVNLLLDFKQENII